MALVLGFGGAFPDIAPTAWLAPDATVIGSATVGAHVSIWFGAVVRADSASITIGAGSNIQDGSVLHADPGSPLVIGAEVAVGHLAVLHGCTVGDGVLIGMNSTVLNGAQIGRGCVVAAGAVVLAGTTFPPRSLVAGVPAEVRRETTDEELAMIAANTANYRALACGHRH